MRFSILIISLFFILSACGVDKLKSNPISGQSNLSSNEPQCSCTHDNSPVCGSDGKNYENICFAQCFKTTVKDIGHCDCYKNLIKVCGIDHRDYTECEAKEQNVTIIKFVPCGAQEI